MRFFAGESIHSGYIPWWNPYVNFGIPQHADMSGGFWNPVTWLIAATVGYNVYSINIECLIYILIGGIGMYKAGQLFGWKKEVRFIAGICYMCCGYFIGNLQHLNWISGAGVLPLCYYFYVMLLKKYSYKKLLQSILAFSFLITSSHPGIIIGSVYFFVFVTISVLLKAQENQSLSALINTSKKTLSFLGLLVLCNIALIVSYSEILPFITRDIKPVLNTNGTSTTSLQSLLSFLLPFATVKGGAFFKSDIALRNCYIGLIPFIFVITALFHNIKRKQLNFFLFTFLFFLFLSTDNFLQPKLYSWLPLLNYVRLPAEFRIFSLFPMLIYGCSALNNYINLKQPISFSNKTSTGLLIAVSMLLLYSISQVVITKNSLLYQIPKILNKENLLDKLKAAIDTLSFYDVIIIQGSICCILLLLITKAIGQINTKMLLLLAIIDVSLATIIQLPFTGYGKLPSRKIQQLLNNSPKGIPTPDLNPIYQNEKGVAGIDSIIGSWSFYSKQPGTMQQAFYPIIFKNEYSIFNPDSIQKTSLQPFIYFRNKENNISNITPQISVQDFSPNSIKLILTNEKAGELILLYKFYPHWKASIDERKVSIEKYDNIFMAIKVNQPGKHTVMIEYNPMAIRILFLLQILLWFALSVIAVIRIPKTT